MGKVLIIKGADFSQVALDVVPIDGPTISISSAGSVTITDEDAIAIYYTINGTTPTVNSTQYNSAFTVLGGTTVKAISQYAGGSTSQVVSKRYNSTETLLYEAPTVNTDYENYSLHDLYPIANIQNTFRGRTITKIRITVNNSGTLSVRKGTNVGTSSFRGETIESFQVSSGENILVFSNPFVLGNDEWLGIIADNTECGNVRPKFHSRGGTRGLQFFYNGTEGGTDIGTDGTTGDNLAFDVYGY